MRRLVTAVTGVLALASLAVPGAGAITVPRPFVREVRVGASEQQVRALLGRNYLVATPSRHAHTVVWLFRTPHSFGFAVTFRRDRVVSIAELGTPY